MVRTLAPGATVNLEVTVENTGGLDDTQDILLSARNGGTQTVDQVTGLSLTSGQTSNVLSLTWDIPQDQALDTYDLVVVTEDDELVVDTYILREANTVPNNGIAQYQLDGDVTDTWGNNDGTNNGVTFIDDSVRGQVGDFNGSGNYLQLPFSADDSSTSISAWVKSDTFGTDSYETIIASYDGASGIALQMGTSNGTVRSIVFDGTGELSAVSSTSINDGTWYHIVGEYNGSDTVRIYVNGLLEDTSTSSIGNIDSSTNYSIGRQPNLNGEFWLGQIDKAEVYDTTLTANEVSRLYKEGSILSYEPFPASAVSRWTFNDADTDGSTALDSWIGNDGTINGSVTTSVTGTSQTYSGGEAYSFDGTDGSVDIPHSPPLNPSSKGLTVSAWVSTTDTVSDNVGIIGKESGSLINGYQLFYDASVTQQPLFIVSDSTDTDFSVQANTQINTGSYIHVLSMLDNVNEEIQIYVDGALEATTSTSGWVGTDTTSDLVIGSYNPGDNSVDRVFIGDIDDPRIHSKPLSGREVYNLYENGSIRETTGTIVDDFEREIYERLNQTISDVYGGDLADGWSRQSSNVFSGAFALESPSDNNPSLISDVNDLEQIEQGDTFRVRVYNNAAGDIQPVFGNQSESGIGSENTYVIKYDPGFPGFGILKLTNGSSSDISLDTSTSLPSNEWVTIEVDWGISGSITATLIDQSGNTVTEVSGTDSEYTSGGIGYRYVSDGPHYIDDVRIVD